MEQTHMIEFHDVNAEKSPPLFLTQSITVLGGDAFTQFYFGEFFEFSKKYWNDVLASDHFCDDYYIDFRVYIGGLFSMQPRNRSYFQDEIGFIQAGVDRYPFRYTADFYVPTDLWYEKPVEDASYLEFLLNAYDEGFAKIMRRAVNLKGRLKQPEVTQQVWGEFMRQARAFQPSNPDPKEWELERQRAIRCNLISKIPSQKIPWSEKLWCMCEKLGEEKEKKPIVTPFVGLRKRMNGGQVTKYYFSEFFDFCMKYWKDIPATDHFSEEYYIEFDVTIGGLSSKHEAQQEFLKGREGFLSIGYGRDPKRYTPNLFVPVELWCDKPVEDTSYLAYLLDAYEEGFQTVMRVAKKHKGRLKQPEVTRQVWDEFMRQARAFKPSISDPEILEIERKRAVRRNLIPDQ